MIGRANRTMLTVSLLAIGLAGCIVRTQPPRARATVRVRATAPPPPPANATVTVQASSPTVASGVTVVEASCTQGAQEVCNGLDDNCNGQIDEGCGYSSGNIQITLAWQGGADLDMYVTDPGQETISYSHRTSASGGNLDQDARGQCNASQPNNTIENVFWDQQNPPPGDYGVQVHYWAGSACSTNAGPTAMTLSISVGGRVLGAYNYVINPDQRIDIASFRI
ncbi:MAG: MopE-related protein [Myxococcota bacterium]